MTVSAEPPPLPPPSRRRWPWVVGGLTLVFAGIVWLSLRPFPSEEEKQYFGWWRGTKMAGTTGAQSWTAEFRRDGRLVLQFRHYHRLPGAAAWTHTTAREEGNWRVRDRVQHLASDDPARSPGWVERLRRLSQDGAWHRQHYYRTESITENEMTYTSIPGGTRYRALRSAVPIPLPDEPLQPEQWPGAPN